MGTMRPGSVFALLAEGTDMKLTDIIDDSYKAERAAGTSERISGLMREGLDRYEKAFKSKFVDIVRERGDYAGNRPLPLESREYSLGTECDVFLHKQLKGKKDVREEYYERVPESRPDQLGYCEDKIQLPPLGMVPLLVYISGLKKLFAGLDNSEKQEIGDMFGLVFEDLEKVFDHFHRIRNKCSHDRGQYQHSEFAFCLEKFTGPSKVAISNKDGSEYLNLENNFFGTMTLLVYMLSNVPYKNTPLWAGEWKHKMIEQLNEFPQQVLREMGFQSGWKDHQCWRPLTRKSILGIGAMYSVNFRIFESMYDGLDADIRREVDVRTQFISNKFIERGWDTRGSGMDNCEWTARACVMRSVLGYDDEGYGFPMKDFDLATALANGSRKADDLLNAVIDFYARRTDNDPVLICIPKGASDATILEKVERWMRFDRERRDSDYYKSLLMQSRIVREGGPIVTITNIFPAFATPFVADIADEMIHEFKGSPENFIRFMSDRKDEYIDELPKWFRSDVSSKEVNRLFDLCRHSLMTKIGENGIKRITYSHHFGYKLYWPQEITIDMNEANLDFKIEVESGYKLRDPEEIGCKPYGAPFSYPFILATDIEEKLQEKAPIGNPFKSVDSALNYSYRYYFNIVRHQLQSKINPYSIHERVYVETACRKLVRVVEGKFVATFGIEVTLGGMCLVEGESKIPIEVIGDGECLQLSIGKMRSACSRETDKLLKRAVRKIKQRSNRS